jgi:predicted NAD/FAD-dependent oxidoreductase
MPESARSRPRAAIVGAGIAGLTAAGELQRAGWAVQVLEKARGVGGRAATRREGAHRFDHGAQYFSCRSTAFTDAVARWTAAGTVQPWDGRIVAFARDSAVPRESRHPRYVGVPGMSAVARQLAEGIDCRCNSRVVALRYTHEWELELASGGTVAADALVLTPPPAQSAALLTTVRSPLRGRLADVAMQPCWALLLAFDQPLPVAFAAAYIDTDSPLAWCARDTSKPGRGPGERWVVHARADWSARHLELDAAAAARQLSAAFNAWVGDMPAPVLQLAHRWRYAQASKSLEESSWYDPDLRLALAGDWCAGSRMEGAWLAGRNAAARIAGSLAD